MAKRTSTVARALPPITHKDLQLLGTAPKPFDGEGWLFELKYDGFRALAVKHGDRIRLTSRQGNELGTAFPEITTELAALPDCIIDGELVVVDAHGIPQFDSVAARSRKSTPSAIAAAARQAPAAFLAFDLLAVENTDLRKTPLIERKKRLSRLLAKSRRVKAVDYVEGSGVALYDAVAKAGLEGIVAKRGDSLYRRARSNDWLKIKTELGIKKTEQRGDSWYGGPGPETRARRVARDGAKESAGNSQSALEEIRRAESKSVTVNLDGETLALTDLDRVLWPSAKGSQPHAVTKRDYLLYLLQVAPYMLPHLADRPLTLFVHPRGVCGPRSVEMHWKVKPPAFMRTVKIYSTNAKRDHTYLLCNNTPSLLWLANAGALEFHTWLSRLDPEPDAKDISTNASGSLTNLETSLLNYPDYIFFDIDSYVYSGKEEKGAEPEYHPEGFRRCRNAALRLRDLLAQMSLDTLVKTSGKTGLHVIVPIIRTMDFTQAREISRAIYERLLHEAPKDFTMEWRVRNRTGKTFLDYGMNRRATSMAAPYTARAVPEGLVSMPITWEELEHIEPSDFAMDAAIARLRNAGDKWRDILGSKQQLGSRSRTS